MTSILSKRIGVLLAAVLLVASAACSNNSSSNNSGGSVLGTIAGTVTSASGAALAGIMVTPSPANAPVATSDASGKYMMPIGAGTYSLTFSGDNVQSATATNVNVTMGQTTTVNQTMAASPLLVKVSVPAALQGGGPAGFNTTVSGIAATVTNNGSDVTGSSTINWTITATDGTSNPPAPATPNPASGASTSFTIPDFETVRQGANLWLNTRYGTAGTDNAFDWISVPERDQLVTFSAEQVLATGYKVTATVTNGSLTSTGSATVSTVTINGGTNMQPLGLMVVANAPSTSTYNWTLQFLPMTATTPTFGPPPADVTLQGPTTKNPWLIPTTAGVYELQNGTDAPLYFRVSTYHGAYHGPGVAAPGPYDNVPGSDGIACSSCHNVSPDGDHTLYEFNDWVASAHENYNFQNPFATPMPLVQAGLDGYIGPHYAQSCMQCHTVGYSTVPSATDKGFYDLMGTTGWTFPTTLQPGNYAALPLDLEHRGSIQCENCHGPLEPADHSQALGIPALFALPLSPVANMSAGVCMQCHDEFPFHDLGSLWSASPHAQIDLVAEATVENRGTTAAHCGRCHAGEGFKVYVAQQQAGNPGLIARPTTCSSGPYCTCTGTPAVCTPNAPAVCTPNPAAGQTYDPACPCTPASGSTTCTGDPFYYAYLNGLGLNNATAHSQTCQTCHDPHKTTLRVDGDSGVNAAGFNVQNAGAGALCIVCHNSRNGAVYADTVLASWSAPHTPSQSDVFAGRNAIFFGGTQAQLGTTPAALPNEAAHKILGDTCVTCHVTLIPADIQAQYTPANTNHTFRSSFQVCVNCHGANIGDIVASQVDGKMTDLSNALGVLFRTKINANGTDAMTVYPINPDGSVGDNPLPSKVTIAAGSVQVVALSTVHGSPALIVTLTDGKTMYAAGVSSFKYGGAALFPVTTGPQQIAAAAFYNYLYVQGGAAHGVHNPSFVNGVLDATMTQLSTVTGL